MKGYDRDNRWIKVGEILFLIVIALGFSYFFNYKNINVSHRRFKNITVATSNFDNNVKNNLSCDSSSENINYIKHYDGIYDSEFINENADINYLSKSIADTLILNKKVTEVKDKNGSSTGEYEIEFNMNKIGADIVFAIDNSYSFGKSNKWSYSVGPYFERLAQRLLSSADKYNRKIRIGVLVFSGNREKVGSIDDATVIQYFSDDLDEITNALKGINNFGDGGYSNSPSSDKYVDILNIEAGLLRAKEMFSDDNFAKYVFLYADGPPTISIGENYSSRYDTGDNNKTYPKYRDAVFKARDTLSDNGIEILALGEKINVTDYLYSNHGNGTVKKNMIETLSGITNIKIKPLGKYEDSFFLDENSAAINLDRSKIFGDTHRYLEKNILDCHENINDIYPLSISDEINDDFTLNVDGYGEGKPALMLCGNNEKELNVDISDDGSKIYFNDMAVDYYGTTIKYKIKLKDEYLIRNDALNGVSSVVSCGDLSEKTFNNPILNIKPIVNISTIENDLFSNQESDSSISEIIIENLNTKEQFKLSANKGNEINYEFIMRQVGAKDNNRSNDNIDKFLSIGKYKIKEIKIENNREIIDVKINGKSIDINDSDENIFLINKQNSNIFIEVNTRKKVEVVRGKINIESITLDSNGGKLSNSSDNDKSSNEVINLRVKSVDGSNRYDFKISLNDNLIGNFYIVNNYYEIPNDIEKGLGVINAGLYKLEEILPMNISADSIEIKYGENDEWYKLKANEGITLNKDSNEVFIRLNHKNTNKKYWFKRK